MIYLLWSVILFAAAVETVSVAELVILRILFLTSFFLELRVLLVAKLVIPNILSSISLILALYIYIYIYIYIY